MKTVWQKIGKLKDQELELESVYHKLEKRLGRLNWRVGRAETKLIKTKKYRDWNGFQAPRGLLERTHAYQAWQELYPIVQAARGAFNAAYLAHEIAETKAKEKEGTWIGVSVREAITQTPCKGREKLKKETEWKKNSSINDSGQRLNS